MASVVSNFTTFANLTRSGSSISWGNTSNAQTSDNTYAGQSGATTIGGTVLTHHLKCTGLASTVPAGSTIIGIKVYIERKATVDSGVAWVTDLDVKLVKAGTIQSTNKADTSTHYPTSDGSATYGGSSDLWSGSWTASDINDAGFGVVLACTCAGGGDLFLGTADTGYPRIDQIYVEIFYGANQTVAGDTTLSTSATFKPNALHGFTFDDFTAGSGTLTGDSTLTSHTWSRFAGTLTKHATGMAECTAGTAIYYTSATASSADYSVTCYMRKYGSTTQTATAGCVARYNSTTNDRYIGGYVSSSAAWRISKVVSSVTTNLVTVAEAWGTPDGLVHEVKLQLVGSQLYLYSDGVLKASATDSSITAAGQAGLSLPIATSDVVPYDGFFMEAMSASYVVAVAAPATLTMSASCAASLQARLLAPTSLAFSATASILPLRQLRGGTTLSITSTADVQRRVRLRAPTTLTMSGSAFLGNNQLIAGSTGLALSGSASLLAQRRLPAAPTAISTALTADLRITKPVGGSTGLAASASCSITPVKQISASTSLGVGLTASLLVTRQLSATASLSASTTANVSHRFMIGGSTGLAISSSADIKKTINLAGSTGLTMSSSCSLPGVGKKLAGSTGLGVSLSASLLVTKIISGSTGLAITSGATISRNAQLSGSTGLSIVPAASVRCTKQLAGSTKLIISTSANAQREVKLAGSTNLTITLEVKDNHENITFIEPETGSVGYSVARKAAISTGSGTGTI